MDFVLAPNAFRIPISRVLSVTDTSIIFITPMPPTSREIAATSIIKMVIILSTCITEAIWLSKSSIRNAS